MLSLVPLVTRLSDLLGTNLIMAKHCIGEGVAKNVSGMAHGDVTLLENFRFNMD